MQPWIAISRRELLAERSEASGDDIHFPERLAERVVASFSAPGEVVLDPFAGSGTVAAVAVRMGRRAIAVELLPERADHIRHRAGPGALVITGDARDLASLVEGPTRRPANRLGRASPRDHRRPPPYVPPLRHQGRPPPTPRARLRDPGPATAQAPGTTPGPGILVTQHSVCC